MKIPKTKASNIKKVKSGWWQNFFFFLKKTSIKTGKEKDMYLNQSATEEFKKRLFLKETEKWSLH